MKGKVAFRFCMPNVARFRSRVENPSADLSKTLRDTLGKVVCDVLNKSTLDIRARFIQEVDALDLNYKSAQHKAKVMSVVESFFDAVFAPTPEALDAIVGDNDTDEAPAEEVAESAPEVAKSEPEDFE